MGLGGPRHGSVEGEEETARGGEVERGLTQPAPEVIARWRHGATVTPDVAGGQRPRPFPLTQGASRGRAGSCRLAWPFRLPS